MNRRKGLLLVMAGVVVSCWYVARFDGDPKPVDPLLVAPLHEAPAWRSQPTLLQNNNEPAAIYVVSGLPGSDGLFEALRLDVNSGARSSARIQFGPNTIYMPFDSVENVGIPAIEFRGLTRRRPTPYLLKFPGPGGPGFHFVDPLPGWCRAEYLNVMQHRDLMSSDEHFSRVGGIAAILGVVVLVAASMLHHMDAHSGDAPAAFAEYVLDR